MNSADHHDQLAAYLGDEMDEESKARFEAVMEEDPALAAEVASLRDALEAMRSLSDEAAPAVVQVVPGAGRRLSIFWILEVFSYARPGLKLNKGPYRFYYF